MVRIKVGGGVRIIPFLKCPRILEVLWTKYGFGVNGNKAANFFTACKRWKVKYSYSLCKPSLTLMERMIRYGYTHDPAIEKIDTVYANGTSKSITQTLREIRIDNRRGGHPLFQYS